MLYILLRDKYTTTMVYLQILYIKCWTYLPYIFHLVDRNTYTILKHEYINYFLKNECRVIMLHIKRIHWIKNHIWIHIFFSILYQHNTPTCEWPRKNDLDNITCWNTHSGCGQLPLACLRTHIWNSRKALEYFAEFSLSLMTITADIE